MRWEHRLARAGMAVARAEAGLRSWEHADAHTKRRGREITMELLARMPAPVPAEVPPVLPDPDRPGAIRTEEQLRARMVERAVADGVEPATARRLARDHGRSLYDWVLAVREVLTEQAAAEERSRLTPIQEFGLQLLSLRACLDGCVLVPADRHGTTAHRLAHLDDLGALTWHRDGDARSISGVALGDQRRTTYRVELHREHPWWRRLA